MISVYLFIYLFVPTSFFAGCSFVRIPIVLETFERGIERFGIRDREKRREKESPRERREERDRNKETHMSHVFIIYDAFNNICVSEI